MTPFFILIKNKTNKVNLNQPWNQGPDLITSSANPFIALNKLNTPPKLLGKNETGSTNKTGDDQNKTREL